MTRGALTELELAKAARTLARRDPLLARILAQHGPPPLWARKPGFATLVHIILEQQVSLASAATMYARLKENVVPLRPSRIMELNEPYLRSLGLTRQKSAYCLNLAESVTSKRLPLSGLSRMSDDEARTTLVAVKGIGTWSADVYLLMALLRPDIFPASDLALITAVTQLKNLRNRPTPMQLLEMAEAWRPFRSVAARMLWQYYIAQREEVRTQRKKQ